MPIHAYTIPKTINTCVVSAIIMAHVLLLVMLPSLLVQSWWWLAVIPATAWMHLTHWALIHEAIHKILHPNTRVNEVMGRVLSILMGTSLPVLRFGHTMHHQFNREWNHEFVPQKTFAARAMYYGHLLFGLYGAEVLSNLLLAILPKKQALALAQHYVFHENLEYAAVGERFFYQRENIAIVRSDTACMLLLYGAAFYVFGAYWLALALFFVTRAMAISFMDNIYHYNTPMDNTQAAKELSLSSLGSLILLHGNYHETHHLNARIPWTQLPLVHRGQQKIFHGNFLQHALQQLDGPLIA